MRPYKSERLAKAREYDRPGRLREPHLDRFGEPHKKPAVRLVASECLDALERRLMTGEITQALMAVESGIPVGFFIRARQGRSIAAPQARLIEEYARTPPPVRLAEVLTRLEAVERRLELLERHLGLKG